MAQEKEFLVSWEVNINAVDALSAAKQARQIQLDPESGASIYEVLEEESDTKFTVDLLEEDEDAVLLLN